MSRLQLRFDFDSTARRSFDVHAYPCACASCRAAVEISRSAWLRL